MNDKPQITPHGAVSATDQALVHQHGVGSALGHVRHGFPHVDNAVQRSHGNPVIHGHYDGTIGFAIENTFQTNFFTEMHNALPCVAGPPLRPGPVTKKGHRRRSLWPLVER